MGQSTQKNPKVKGLALPKVSDATSVPEVVENTNTTNASDLIISTIQQPHDGDEQSSDSGTDPTPDEGEGTTGKIGHVRSKKHRRTPYVSKRGVPLNCQKIFSTQSGGAVQVRPPYQNASNIKLLTTRAFHHYPYQTLLDEMNKSANGTSNVHVFDLAQQVRITAETVFRFTTPAGSGLVPQSVLNEYIQYCEECESDALAELMT